MGITRVVRHSVFSRYPVCPICRNAPATTIDHIWPRRYGGTDDEGNLQALCEPCNSRKNGRQPPEGMLPLYGQLDRPPYKQREPAIPARRRARETKRPSNTK